MPAFALPGDSINAVVSRMKHKGFKVSSGISEIGGYRVYRAVTPYRGSELELSFQTLGGPADEEMIGYIGSLDFNKRGDPRIREVLSLVYDRSIAGDFLTATGIGRAGIFQTKAIMTFYRGRRFGYSAYGSNFQVWPLSKLMHALAEAKRCATRDCGD